MKIKCETVDLTASMQVLLLQFTVDVDQVAIAIMDEKVGDRVNVLNLARYQTRQKQAWLHDLQMQYKQYGGDDGGANGSADRGGSAGGGKHGDCDGKGDTTKSGDNKEDEEGQVIKSSSVVSCCICTGAGTGRQKRGSGGWKFSSGVQGQSPSGGLGAKPSEAGG